MQDRGNGLRKFPSTKPSFVNSPGYGRGESHKPGLLDSRSGRISFRGPGHHLLAKDFHPKRSSMPGVQQRGPGVVAPALHVGSYLNVKLATPFVPSLNFTTSWRLVPAHFLLVVHT